jgi:hypothetical protein
MSKFLSATIGAVSVGAALATDHPRVLGPAFAGASLLNMYAGLAEDIQEVKVRHIFQYLPLSPDEQRAFCADRKNMSFRSVASIESGFGMRVAHSVVLSELLPSSMMKQAADIMPMWKKMGILGIEKWEQWLNRDHATAKYYRPLSESVIQTEGQAVWAGKDASPEEVRHALRDTVPSVNGAVFDVTLYKWMTTHPRFAEAKDFADAKKFLTMSHSVNGMISMDLTSYLGDRLYQATTVLSMLHYMTAKHAVTTETPRVQDWGL